MDGAAPFTFGLLNPSFHSPSDPRWSASLPESISSPYYRFDLSGVSSVETFRGAESSTFEVEQFQRMDVSPKEGRRFMVRRQRSNEMQSMLKSPFYGSSSNTRHEHIDFDSIELGGRSQEIGKDVEVTANEQDEAMMEEGLKKIRLPTVEKIGIQVKTLNGHLVPIECVNMIPITTGYLSLECHRNSHPLEDSETRNHHFTTAFFFTISPASNLFICGTGVN